MQIKRFEARDMQEALRQVKEVLGPEAIILSTKTVKKPGDRYRMAKPSVVEVVAATDLPVTEPAKSCGKPPAVFPSQVPDKKGIGNHPRGSLPPENFVHRTLPGVCGRAGGGNQGFGARIPQKGGHRKPALVTCGGN